MVSHQGFRILGYVYGTLVTIASLFVVLHKSIQLDSKQTKETDGPYDIIYLLSSLIMLIFSVMLLVGICKNNLTLVKIYRVYLIVTSIISFILISLAVIYCIVLVLFSEFKIWFVFPLIGFMVLFAVMIGLYLLFMWIINGVLTAVQSEQEVNDVALDQPDTNCKPNIPNQVAV